MLALWVLPVLLGLFIAALVSRKRLIKRFGDYALTRALMPDVGVARLVFKFILVTLALASIIIALARPQFGSKIENVKRKGVEVVIALDVSNSMKAEDIQPNRLEKSKMAISRLTERMKNDKIGIVIFAGDAYTQLPITADYGAAKLFLNTIKTNFIQEQGTAVGKAIDLAMNSFTGDTEIGKAIIVISDGENHEDDAVAKAKEAAAKGIVVHTIGMGTPDGAPIPVENRYNNDFQKDKDGNVVITRINEQMLRDIAIAGQGMYVRASNSSAGLDVLYDEINKMAKKDIESKIYTAFDEKYQYFVALAILLLFLEFVVLERKNKILKKIKLFEVSVKSKIKR